MLKSLVSPRSSTHEHIEAITEERDFFREKYAAQMNEMEALKGQLKESQRMIDRLRKRVLDLEMGGAGADVDGVESEKKDKLQADSSNTSLTSMIHEDTSTKSSSIDDETTAVELNKETETTRIAPTTHEETRKNEPDIDADPSDNEDDEADRIRANAERLLQWSDYQSRRSTSSPTDTPSRGSIVDGRRSFAFDDKKGGDDRYDSISATTPSPKMILTSSAERTNDSNGGGRVGKFLDNLMDKIDPLPTYSDDERDESIDEDKSTDHRSSDFC